MFVCVLKRLLGASVTLGTGHWRHIKEGATEAGVFLFHLCILSALSVSTGTPVTRTAPWGTAPRWGKEKEERQSGARGIRPTRTPVKLAGRLPNMVFQLWMWSILGRRCRRIHTHKHTRTRGCYYLYSVITLTHLFTCPLMPARKMSCISIVPLGRVCH